MTIKKGNKVKVDYVGTLENGEVFDSSKSHGAPLEFEVGSGQMIIGFDEAVQGMELGQEKNVLLEPPKAYGDHNPALVQKIPSSKFPAYLNPQPGMTLGMQLANGQQLPVRIVAVEKDFVTMDLNHPLAGKRLKFWIKVVEIE